MLEWFKITVTTIMEYFHLCSLETWKKKEILRDRRVGLIAGGVLLLCQKEGVKRRKRDKHLKQFSIR